MPARNRTRWDVLLVACLLPGCSARPEQAEAPEEPLTLDQSVLNALEPYDPIYKYSYGGKVIALRLEGRRIPASALDEVARLTELKTLSLYAASLNDDSLAKLSGLKNLESLGLGATPITEKGLVHLEPLTALKWMWLSKELTTTPAAEKLKTAVPDLNIYPQ